MKEANMAKAKKAKVANVVSLTAFRQTRTRTSASQESPQQAPQGRPIWSHAKLAAWCLWHSTENSVFTEDNVFTENSFLLNTDWEVRFLASMIMWEGAPTERQRRCLHKIRDKIDLALMALDEPNPAA
jgi:hypothetical protein